MRGLVVPFAIAVASVGSGASAAQPTSYVHLLTERPFGRTSALYDFTFTSQRDNFQSALVFFNLNGGVRYGCGVHANANCTLQAAGQTLTLVGLSNGIEGSFAWSGNAALDNYPLEISIGLRMEPAALDGFHSSIHLVSPVPEPEAWLLMIGGFGLLGTACRGGRRRSVQRSWLSLLPRRLMPPRTMTASRAV
ncbi:PEPxxWA-CTERM sorting domain-containing protein [Sphingomonas sp.]|uniref:PEPxxWA-CTERM sorting domain-containing protein n=1 Tax=Sphingomonas sp. TaxID=28214 RepID=UPI002DBA4C7B|nr:PEPxxWA-CTERM sorting domain-containing protein [Sphingomonas sp.]HEU4969350.1 PEPxxWA-CTERM sorting domain-containing protein [Sphingomonas sp.]